MTLEKMEVFGPNEHIPCIPLETVTQIQSMLDQLTNEAREFTIESDGTVVFFIDAISTEQYTLVEDSVRAILSDESITIGFGLRDEETGEQISTLQISRTM